ncbi:MAG: hypothetical protein U9Q66_03390 [Patescibacteria group bacterium]|nr:hypothetical protein [Patescibacteria group bacterium]
MLSARAAGAHIIDRDNANICGFKKSLNHFVIVFVVSMFSKLQIINLV